MRQGIEQDGVYAHKNIFKERGFCGKVVVGGKTSIAKPTLQGGGEGRRDTHAAMLWLRIPSVQHAHTVGSETMSG